MADRNVVEEEEGEGKKNSFELTISLSSEVFETVQRTSIVDFLVPPPFFLPPFPLFPFFPFFFPLFQTHFTLEGIPTESNISHRNGRTISTFSELIIGEWCTRFKGRKEGGGRRERGCQLLQIHRDLLAKSTRDVCMKIHVNIQLCTLTICKFPGN